MVRKALGLDTNVTLPVIAVCGVVGSKVRGIGYGVGIFICPVHQNCMGCKLELVLTVEVSTVASRTPTRKWNLCGVIYLG